MSLLFTPLAQPPTPPVPAPPTTTQHEPVKFSLAEFMAGQAGPGGKRPRKAAAAAAGPPLQEGTHRVQYHIMPRSCSSKHMRVHTHTHTHTHAHTHTRTHTHTHANKRTNTNTYKHIHAYVCAHAHMSAIAATHGRSSSRSSSWVPIM
jgi:hypothetical protein